MTVSNQKKIAIIGTGISGMGAASLLHPHHDITVYEKNARIGGHSRTLDVATPQGQVAVDTGFIVFNKRNYPLLTRLFDHYQVPIAPSDMSFGASIDHGWLEYGTQKTSAILAQKTNLLRPAFWGMVADIMKFNAKAGAYVTKDPRFTLGDCLDELKMGAWFRKYYLLAMGGAIWSTPLAEMLKFPACAFIRFFTNHGLLTVNDQPQWYTVQGGSREYINRITAPFHDRILLDRGAAEVWRTDNHVKVIDTHGQQVEFDEVVFACHADQALRILQNPTADERNLLSGFRYQPNRAVLHSDISFMPKRRAAWASWVYLCEGRTDSNPCVSLSYWMNHLQPLATELPLIVTLNPGREPNPALVHNDHIFDHPVFDQTAVRNQGQIDSIQGVDRLWFCGAYQRYGFHEDGLGSAVTMAHKMGIDPVW